MLSLAQYYSHFLVYLNLVYTVIPYIKMFKRAYRFFSAYSQKDYYKTLGVTRTASKSEIRSAYLKLAKQYHPDSPTGNEEKFKELGEAWSVLGNETSKTEYDNGGYSDPSSMHQNYGRSRNDYYSNTSDYQKWQNFYQEHHTRKTSFEKEFEDFINQSKGKESQNNQKFKTFKTEYYKFYDPKTGQTYYFRYTTNNSQKQYKSQSGFDDFFSEKPKKKSYKTPLDDEVFTIGSWNFASFIFSLVTFYFFIKLLTRNRENNAPHDFYRAEKRGVWDDFEDEFQREFNKRR